MQTLILDIEADNLLRDATKVWCIVSYLVEENTFHIYVDKDEDLCYPKNTIVYTDIYKYLSFLEDKYNQDIENYDATTEVLASTGNKVYHYDPQFSSMVEESKNNKKAKIRAENRKAKLEKEDKIELQFIDGTKEVFSKEKDIEKINDLLNNNLAIIIE